MLFRSFSALALLFFLALPHAAQASAQDEDGIRRLVNGTHSRLTFSTDVERVAVGNPELMDFEAINTRELLLLGQDIGRTSLVIWFTDGTVEESQWVIQPDLRVLEAALRDIDLSITASVAPDREAIVLRGFVNDQALAIQAESMTRDYLQVGSATEERDSRTEESQSNEGEDFPEEGDVETETTGSRLKRSGGTSGSGKTAVINLIRYKSPEFTPIEERIEAAISNVAGPGVVVRRVTVGTSNNNDQDIFVLEGSVPDQISLTRVVQLAARVLDPALTDTIEVVADEAGGLTTGGQQQGGGNTQGGGGAGGQSLFGGGGQANNLRNRIRTNIGRATVLSAAGGRVLSFIEVRSNPQVRLEVQFYEVNRTKLRSRSADLRSLGANFDESALLAGPIAESLQGTGMIDATTGAVTGAAPIRQDDAQVAASWFDGLLSGQLQFNLGRFALDTILQFLQTEGIARSLQRPNLVVLSGETALFQVGGEVPIQTAAGNVNLIGVNVEFRQFGVQISVRPLVGKDGFLTVDISPQIVLPDASLTSQIASTSGSSQATTAFSSRSMQTTARMRDGEVLVLGGLVGRMDSEDRASVPGLNELPLVGWAFENESRNGDHIELLVVVNPVIVHESRPEVRLWELPSQLGLAIDSLTPERPLAVAPR